MLEQLDTLEQEALASLERASDPAALAAWKQAHLGRSAPLATLLGELGDADALIVRSATRVTPDLMQKAPHLRVVGAHLGSMEANIDQIADRLGRHYASELARLGLEAFCKVDAGHAAALNMREGRLVNRAVAAALPDLPCA